MSAVELRCNSCAATFPEDDMGDTDVCPSCGGDSLLEREVNFKWMRNDGIDSIPWPKAIAIRPVEVSDELLKIARKRLARMAV